MRGAVDAARAERDTLGGIVEVRATGVPPGLGSYATKDGPARRTAGRGAHGDPGGEGRRGRGRVRPAARGSAAHDEIGGRGFRRESNRAGGIEAGTTNGEEVVVRAAMKPLPTLMRPLPTVDLDFRRARGGARRAERRLGGRGARRCRRGRGRVGARARGAGEVRRRRARRPRRGPPRLPGPRPVAPQALDPARRARRLHGRRQVELGRGGAASLGRPLIDVDPSWRGSWADDPGGVGGARRGEPSGGRGGPRRSRALADPVPAVLALGGGAPTVRQRPRGRAGARAHGAARRRGRGGLGRVRDTTGRSPVDARFRRLYDAARSRSTPRSRTPRARDVHERVLAAGGDPRRARRARGARRARPGQGHAALVCRPACRGNPRRRRPARARRAPRLRPTSFLRARRRSGLGVERLWRRAPRRPRRGRSSRSAAAARPTPAGSPPRPTCAGIPVGSVPTSLVGQVDAGIGGKTGMTSRAGRTSSAPSTGPSVRCSTPRCSRRSRTSSGAKGWPKS